MAAKLFVGSLAYGVKEDQLKELFETVGAVASCAIIMDRDSGQSKGFGFIEMSNDADAQTAIKDLNGKELEGRTIIVNEAKPKEDRGARPSYGGSSRY